MSELMHLNPAEFLGHNDRTRIFYTELFSRCVQPPVLTALQHFYIADRVQRRVELWNMI
jgi:hypothetical protein